MGVRRGSDSVVGSELAGYLIEVLIGRGGMGAVYRAEEEGLGRKVALKVIAPELAQDERFRERFLRESRIAASLDHPHVIPIHRAGEEDGVLFLSMRYVEGTDLARLLAEEGALDPRRALELLSQVAEALDAAHEQGLVHRDVKPSNVLIARSAAQEHCYLADFGVTKRMGSLSGVSAPGDVVGTIEYVAPEQVTGDPVDKQADVYSLACVLYECLTGQPPFSRATDVALLWAHVHEDPDPPTKFRAELPRRVDTVLARALAKEPARRYPTCGELVAETRAALGLVATAPAPTSRLRWAVPAVVVALVAVAALTFVLTRNSGGPSFVSPNSVGVIDADSNDLVDEIAVGARPDGVAVGAGAVWVSNSEEGTISQIDAETRRLVHTFVVGGYPSDVAIGKGAVWTALTEHEVNLSGVLVPTPYGMPPQLSADVFVPKLAWFSPNSASPEGATLQGLGCPHAATRVAIGRRAVWFACDTVLGRVDPRTGTPTLAYEAAFVTPPSITPDFSDIAYGLGSLWLANRATNTITEIDPSASRGLREITVGQAPSALAVGPGSVWVASFEDDAVTWIDVPGGGRPVTTNTIPVGDGPTDVAVGEDSVWVANSLDGTVTRIDPETGEVVATIEIGNQPQRLAVGEGAVWVTVRGSE